MKCTSSLLAVIITLTASFSSPAKADKLYLNVGDTVTIGSTQVTCGRSGPECSPLDSQNLCRLTYSDGTCREYTTTYYSRGAGECKEDCRLEYSDRTCREKNTCEFNAEQCCFKKTTCRLTYSDGTCREWQTSRCE
jgi:hypothetical protein